MIDRQHGRIVIVCDFCDEVFEGASDAWQEIWSAAKRDGWSTRKIADKWVHGCGKCGIPT